ncbi:MAG: hypothetical protein ACREPB_01575 [Arenimonas sp.]
MAGLNVKAQGTEITSDDRLIFAVEVRDNDGNPVLGLKKSSFKIYQLGHLFGELNVDIVVSLHEIAGLEGYYHVVRKNWPPAVNGTFAFQMTVRKGRSSGQTMTWVVKVDGGPK